MKFSYHLKRVCGNVYTNGNLIFTPDGNSIISPIGNRLNIFDLINQTCEALPLENRNNIALVALSHNGMFLISIDVDGCALFFNLPRRVLIHKFNFKRKVYDVKFSPNDKYFAITFGRGVQIWKTPSLQKEFCPLQLSRTIQGHHDDANCLDWSSDSNSIIIGSKDLTARVYFQVMTKRIAMSVLAGHRDEIIGAYFGDKQTEAYTVASDGGLFVWQYINISPDEKDEEDVKEEEDEESEDESDGNSGDDEEAYSEEEDDHNPKNLKLVQKTQQRKGHWQLVDRQLLRDHQGVVTCSTYNRKHQILVLGFQNGVFGLYEMPSCTNIHRISVSSSALNAVCLNSSGDWLGLGAVDLGQLLVWEWKSESYILKQQGHLYGLNTLEYSSEGQYIVTGGDDGKVKLWNALSGFCIATFKDHLAPVTGVKFIGHGQGKAILSASLDGTIRAYDLLRYKNFRTLTTPTPVQFTCMTADSMGEIVCAGGLDPFNIYVWSLQTGKLLEILAGHEGPIACLDISVGNSTLLASGSWDGTLKLWNIFQNQCIETFEHGCDVLALAFRPDAKEIACSSTNGNIYVWDIDNGVQLCTIEGRQDIAGGRLSTDRRSADNSTRSKYFTSLTYSADGTCILAGGKSKFICLYAIASQMLVKKFQLSHNRSMEGILDHLRSDKLVDGVNVDSVEVTNEHLHKNQQKSLTQYGDYYRDYYHANKQKMKEQSMIMHNMTLPGNLKKQQLSEIQIHSLKFSPTGSDFAVACTDGLQLFTLDTQISFIPITLNMDITKPNVFQLLHNADYTKALIMALYLQDKKLIHLILESTPLDHIDLIVKNLTDIQLLKDLIQILSEQLIISTYLELYLRWTMAILQQHTMSIQNVGRSNLAIMEALRSLLRSLLHHEKELMKMVNDNNFMLDYLLSQLSLQEESEMNQEDSQGNEIDEIDHFGEDISSEELTNQINKLNQNNDIDDEEMDDDEVDWEAGGMAMMSAWGDEDDDEDVIQLSNEDVLELQEDDDDEEITNSKKNSKRKQSKTTSKKTTAKKAQEEPKKPVKKSKNAK